MKTIGLLGGMSWESTQTYYALINREVKKRLGGLHSAKIIMVSVDFAEIEALQVANDWDGASRLLSRAAQQLEAGGADCVAICTNTMHEVFDQISASVAIPCLHIGDALGKHAVALQYQSLGLLGTQFTMERPFLKDWLSEHYNIDVVVPEIDGRNDVHQIIYRELCLGEINPKSRDRFIEVMHYLMEKDVDGIVLGCTEIGLLIDQSMIDAPVLDTTSLHAHYLVDFSLSNNERIALAEC